MDFIRKEVVEVKEKRGNNINNMGGVQFLQLVHRDLLRRGKTLWWVLMMSSLSSWIRSWDNNPIIPIIGMSGIGKTTLTLNVYENSVIVPHFDIRSWVTISQEYSVREILLELLHCQKSEEDEEALSGESESKLGEMLYKSLCDRRYMIVLDDMWSVDIWDKINFLFPNNNNGSRIIIIARLSLRFTGNHGLEKNFLIEEISWNLLCKIVFGTEDGCPLELEEVGKKIAKSCKGLPLAIVVSRGLLAKSKQTLEYWEYIAESLNSIVNLEDNKHCLNIQYMSYIYLLVHLKPCFLYMGAFHEHSKIYVPELVKLWVAERFLKATSGKSLEEIAEESIKELIYRNLSF